MSRFDIRLLKVGGFVGTEAKSWKVKKQNKKAKYVIRLKVAFNLMNISKDF